MAIELLTQDMAVADQPGLCVRELERITRAAGAGRGQVAAAIVEGAGELLQCDAAVLLRPTQRPDMHAVTRAPGNGAQALHEHWELGPAASQVFVRAGQAADGWRLPWSGLRMRLRGLNIRSWASIPLECEGAPGPLGALVVGSQTEGRPCGRMHRLADFGLSASVALVATTEVEQPTLQPAQVRVHEDLRRIGNLSFGVSHSLGNIFGALLGNLHFLEADATSDEQRESIARIVQSVARGIELMRDLQAFTHTPVTSGMGPVDLSEVARETAGLAMRLCGHWPSCRGVEIDTELASSAPAWGDARQIRETIVAMVFNAIEAVRRDGHVLVRTVHKNRRSAVLVIDDGPGMSDEVLRRATEPFFTTHPSLHQGLGLTLARAVAVGHRGALTLNRSNTGGLEVALQLPQDPPSERSSGTVPGTGATPGHRKGCTG